MKPVTLPPDHYAARWTAAVRPVPEVNQLGIRYARLADGPEKEALLLEICQAFHSYVMKYLTMICRGRVPLSCPRPGKSQVNKDVEPFLRYFLAKGTPVNKQTLTAAAKRFHLAFKGMETEEIYNVLMGQLLAAIRGYDPDYTAKVKLVAETIDHELSKQREFSAADVGRYVEFDCDRHLSLLRRKGFLDATAAEGKKAAGYLRAAAWPPPGTFFKSGPIGFTYYIQTWFRYGLQAWIHDRMGELETKDGVYSWDFSLQCADRLDQLQLRGGNVDGTFIRGAADETVVSADAPEPDADSSLTSHPIDIGKMSMKWVREADSPLFRGLEPNERLLLYLLYGREMDIQEVARSLGCTTKEVRRREADLLEFLRQRAEGMTNAD
jgi:DNA-directed RNA polymerase specialized sigma24 family protein